MILTFAFDKGSIVINYRKGYPLRFSLWLPGCLLLILLTSCNSKKYLLKGQSFLKDNIIQIKSDHKVDEASALKEELAKRYRQNQTRTVAGIPRHIFYYQYQERLRRDSLKSKPTIKKWSEERLIKNRPVIHDSLKAEQTTLDFEKYLALRGYRRAKVTFKAKTSDKETTVFYRVNPGPRTYVDTFVIAANDTALLRLVEAEKKNSLFRKGTPLDIEIYIKERARLVSIFQNHGYATFDETFISPLEVDTNAVRVKATMRLKNETDSTFHKKYYVGDVVVYPNYHFSDTLMLNDTIIRNVRYITSDSVLTLKPEAIERNLFIHQGDLTKKDNLSQSVRNLGKIELLKFVTPSSIIDTISSGTPKVNYVFFLTRNKKIPLQGNIELTYSNINVQKKSLLGAAVSGNYRDLNLFHGAEVLNLNFEYGVEFNFKAKKENQNQNFVNSENVGAGISLSFPRFIDPLHLYHIIGGRKSADDPSLVGNKLKRWLLYDATSRVNMSYNRVKIVDLYRYYSINAGLNYDIKPDAHHTLSIERFGFDLFSPDAFQKFQDSVLSRSLFLQQSFSKQLFTGLIIKSYFFDYNPSKETKGIHIRLINSAEISGVEVLAINSLTNLIFNKTKGYYLGKSDGLPGDTITFSHFIKGEFDFRYFYNFNSHSQFAFRINTGIAAPFGFTTQVPYIKQFWVGGAQSIRAWQVRELGPGSYKDTFYVNHLKTLTTYYQTGDFKLDMSAEMRFPLFWYFNGAVFLDAANVWTLKNDPSRPGTQFTWNFLEQLGIGYGYGLRIDLDYFILRLDLGYKLYNPYKINGTHILKDELKKFPGGAQAQIAVGLNFD